MGRNLRAGSNPVLGKTCLYNMYRQFLGLWRNWSAHLSDTQGVPSSSLGEPIMMASSSNWSGRKILNLVTGVQISLRLFWVLNSMGECHPYKMEVAGSNPTGPIWRM